MIEFVHLDIEDITPQPEMDINGNMMAFLLKDTSILTVSRFDGAARLHRHDDTLPVSLSEEDLQQLKVIYEEDN